MNTANHGKKDAFDMSLTGYTLKRIQTRKKTEFRNKQTAKIKKWNTEQ
jgi:hypothetical protein